ncbi:MAG: MSHA biogenesis protein MshJ [Pseudohongiellaceae bacterium]|jgi:MSHA biogenesis protein MshJ
MSGKVNQQITVFVKSIESRTQAEKMAIFTLVLAALVMGYLSFVSDPVKAAVSSARNQIASVTRQIGQQQASYTNMLAQSLEDPNKFANDRLAVVERERAGLDRQIRELAGDLISPTDMTRILTSVLERQSGLELISFQNLDVTELLAGDRNSSESVGDSNVNQQSISGQVFEHGLRLEFQGDYFSTIKYLRFIEEISGSFFWDSISFRQVSWPDAVVILEIHTISTNSGFIGV